MGFLSSLLAFAAPIAGAVLGVPAAVPAAAAPTPTPAAPAGIKPSIIDLAEIKKPTAFGVKGTIQDELAVGERRRLALLTGRNRVTTIVQTRAPDGTLLDQETLEGRPFLMNKDIVQLKRTLKLIGKAERRVPRARSRGQAEKEENAKLRGLIEGMIAGAQQKSIQVIDTGS